MLLEIKGFSFVKNFLEVSEAIVFVKNESWCLCTQWLFKLWETLYVVEYFKCRCSTSVSLRLGLKMIDYSFEASSKEQTKVSVKRNAP